MQGEGQKGRIKSADFLRCLAVLYIVGVRHLDDYAADLYQTKVDILLGYGLLGVFVFLSGYLLSLSNFEVRGWRDFSRFFRKRFLRIYPLYALALVLFVSCSIMSARDAILSAFFLNILAGKAVPTLWFIELIGLFYLLFPFVVYRFSLRKTGVILVALLMCLACTRKCFGLIDQRLFVHLPLFFLGIVAARQSLFQEWLLGKRWLGISIILCVAASFLFLEAARYRSLFTMAFMISVVPIWFPIGHLCSNIINESVYQAVAYASFCMYLFHRVVFHVLLQLYLPESNIGVVVYLSLLGMPVLLGVSYLVQDLYDRGRMKLGQISGSTVSGGRSLAS